jgi:hypothetical protein
MTISPALGCVVYFDADLSADSGALVALWERLTLAGPADQLTQWTSSERTQQLHKPELFDAISLRREIESGVTASAAVETPPSTPDRERLLVLAQTTPAPKLRESVPPRQWRYSVVVALGPVPLTRLGPQAAVDAVVAFADAVMVKAGVMHWTETTSYAGALAMGAGGGLTATQEGRVADSLYWRSHWGRIIRGPEWGTFLSAAHVDQLGSLTTVEDSCAHVIRLASGGAFLQLTDVREPILDGDIPPQLAALRSALIPLLGVK